MVLGPTKTGKKRVSDTVELRETEMAKKSKSAQGSGSESAAGTPRLQELYNTTVRPALAEKLSRKNPHAIPQIEKIVINMGVGTAVTEKTSRRGHGSAQSNSRPEASSNIVAQSSFWVQVEGRLANRMQGDAERAKDVRVSRSPHCVSTSTSQGLSWPFG